MAKVSHDAGAVKARIVYWGIEGCGKSANLRAAHSKLRPDHRGDIREEPSRLDPSVTYEVLPISLGEIAGMKTQIEMISVPGGADQAPMRKQLLDQVDGVVVVVDGTASIEDNTAAIDELRQALAAYGRRLDSMPVVLQYNKRDVADPYAMDDIHRKINLGDAPVFEAVATDGTGVLQTLSTISKRVIRSLREQEVGSRPPEPSAPSAPLTPQPAPTRAFAPVPRSSVDRMEEAILNEGADPDGGVLDDVANDARTLLDAPLPSVGGEIVRPEGARLGPDFSIVSVGEACRVGDRSVRVPLVLGDGEGGTSTLVLTLQLDVLVEEDSG
jgi:signal recognition particle receptor subunit beta